MNVQPVPTNQEFPLSFMQERYVMYNRLEPENFQPNTPFVFRIQGKLDVNLLAQSLTEVQRRHSILRTIYPKSSPPCQVILGLSTIRLAFQDLRRSSVSVDWQEAAKDIWQRPFDLARDIPMRGEVLQVEDEVYILFLVIHHIACDFQSEAILLREIETCYTAFLNGSEIQLPPPKTQYKDFAIWQCWHKDSEAWLRQANWWLQTLAGQLPISTFPPDRPAPMSKGFADQFVYQTLPKEFADQLRSFSKKNQVSLFALLFSTFNILLHEFTGETDLLIGVPVSARNSIELERTIGSFAHLAQFRTDLSGNPTFLHLLQQTARHAYAILMHRDFPLYLLSELEPTRTFSRRNLNRIDFNLHNIHLDGLRLPGLAVERILLIPPHNPDLGITIMNYNQKEIQIAWNYDSGQYSQAYVENWTTQYRLLLEKMINSPNAQLK